MKNIFIVCLKFGPGNWQHMKSFGSRLNEKGYNSIFLLTTEFKWMNNEFSENAKYVTTSKKKISTILWDTLLFCLYRWYSFVKIFRQNKPHAVLFVMWHPLNFFVAKLVKKINPRSHLFYWMHEPYKQDKSEHKGKALAFSVIEYLQEMLIPILDTIVLHSKRGFNAFNIRYPGNKHKTQVIPLLFKDEYKADVKHSKRPFDITFIGNAAPAKGIDSFFMIVKENMEINSGLKLQLVTSSTIDEYLNKLKPGWNNYLKIINKDSLSDDEIREACAKSISVITPYKETTQSGVIPVAFMNATPIIGTNIEGLHEYIEDKVNGVFIPTEFTYDDLLFAYEYIKNNFPALSKNARMSFKKIWSDRNWKDYYEWLEEKMMDDG